MGVGNPGGKVPEATRPRPRLRTAAGPTPALQGCRDGRGDLPSAVPAAGSGLPLREDREGTRPSPGPAELPEFLGRVPEESLGELRDPIQDRSAPGTTSAWTRPAAPRGEAEADPGRGRPAGSVHGVHRTRARVDQAVLSDPGRGLRGRGPIGEARPTCPICGADSELTVDHIVPRALGGPDSPANRRYLCRRCNSVKGPRIVSDDALRSYRSFERLTRRMGLGLDPPPLGCTGPAPILNRLAQFARARTLGGGA